MERIAAVVVAQAGVQLIPLWNIEMPWILMSSLSFLSFQMTKESEKSLKVSRNVDDKTNRADEIQLRSTNSGSESRRETNNRNNKKSPLPHKAGLPPSESSGLNNMGPALTVSETHSSQNGHPDPPAPASGGAIRALNKCCLCWCCCCSCSW